MAHNSQKYSKNADRSKKNGKHPKVSEDSVFPMVLGLASVLLFAFGGPLGAIAWRKSSECLRSDNVRSNRKKLTQSRIGRYSGLVSMAMSSVFLGLVIYNFMSLQFDFIP